MRMKISNWIIWLVVGIGIGFTLGRLCDWGYFELSKEVSIVDALNIFITIGLTLYIASVLDKRLKREQFKSDLFIAKIEQIESLLIQIENLIQDKNIEYQKINTLVHIIGIAKNSLIDSISEDKGKHIRFDSINNNLKEKHKDLKSLLTDRPIEKNNLSVVVSDNKVTYSLERITNIVSKCYSIKEEYFKLKVLLNE